MFEPKSRYANLETKEMRVAEGTGERILRYKARRFLPQGTEIEVESRVVFTRGDRLDLMAARTLGDPRLFWQVCDANDALDPSELESRPGSTISIPRRGGR